MGKSAVKGRPAKQHSGRRVQQRANRRTQRLVEREPSASAPVLMARAAALVLAGALVVAPWLPWEQHQTGWTLLSQTSFADLTVAVVCAVPGAVMWVAALVRRSSLAGVVAAIITGLGAMAVLVGALSASPGWPGLGLGLAVVAFPLLLVVGIPVVFTADRRIPRSPGVSRVGAVIVVAALVAAGVSYGGTWYAGRAVTSTTAAVTPATALAARAGQVLWTVTAGSDAAAVTLPDGLVALKGVEGADISVRDAATGAERWHYTRRGASLSDLVASGDGSTLVAVYRVKDYVAVGFDPATGAVRWQRTFQDTFLPLPAALVHLDGTQISAYDPDTGRSLWQLPLGQQFCGNTGSLAAGAGLVVALAPCVSVAPAKAGDVVAVDATGRVRWTTPSQGQAQDSSSSQVTLVSQDAVVASVASAMQALVLDPTTGHVRWTVDTSTETVQAVGDGVALTSTDGRIALRDAATGAPSPAQPPADLMPSGATVAAATISDHRAYVLLDGDHPRLAVVDTTTGRVLGSYALPGTVSSGTVQASTGAAVVTAQSGGSTTITAIGGPA